ncbi:MAG TPA: polysaccharide deacetylase family protein [Polyangia bacterium]|nr:polysaccharide deacetylase family protein [Polyangia bacterium]
MKLWRQIRGILRASFHVALVVGPLLAIAFATSRSMRLAAVALALVAFALLVRAAFIYIPGFDPLFRVPWRGPRRGRRMAITFDDGPNGAVTEEILELFARHGAKATFFMIGENIDRDPELARRIAREGHAVGSHTYSHRKLSQIPPAEAVDEIERGHDALVRAGVPDRRLFRAPHGLKTFAIVRHLQRRGLRLLGWTSGVYDTDCPSGAIIARRALPWLRPGSILLLHDGKFQHDRRPLLAALPVILEAARQRGLELVTVPELLGWSS